MKNLLAHSLAQNLTASSFLFSPYWHSLLLIFFLMTVLWGISLYLRDASIVDRFWGIGFILVSFQQFFESRLITFRSVLMLALVSIWGLRLSIYIHQRNRRTGEDRRYQKMRLAYGSSFWWKSFFIIFAIQGGLMWILSAPFGVVQLFPQPDGPTILDILGIFLWAFGFVFETTADYQLSEFKRNPNNQGKVCRTGLWNLSRHPNYFGESVLWWGYWIICLNADYGWATILSPVLMTYLLIKVSGVSLLEDHLRSTKPGYVQYVKEVPPFIPWPRR